MEKLMWNLAVRPQPTPKATMHGHVIHDPGEAPKASLKPPN